MNTIRKRHLVAAVAAVAVLGVAGTALAAGPPPNAPRLGQHAQAGQGYGVMAGGVVMDAAADYLGLTETQLATLRHGGTSLAQIAVDKGKTAAGLQQALVAAFKANLDKAVAAGRITQAQATQALARFQANVQAQITRTATGPMNGRGAGAGLGLGLGLGPCGGRA
jgi:hypothetical protein